MKINYIYIFLLSLVIILPGCSKSDEQTPYSANKGTLNYVVRDNFGLTYLAAALNRTGLEKDLATTGPFTLLAPSDEAYKKAGFDNPAAVFTYPITALAQRHRYHILKSELRLSNIPLGMNQPRESSLGSMLYVSKVIKGVDTIITINGARVLRPDTRATNGLMHVIDGMLIPNVYDNVKDAIAGDIDLSLFYHALKRSGVLNELLPSESYTVFAVTNIGMQNFGLTSIEAIEAANSENLRKVLQYHIARSKKFTQDYFLLAVNGQNSYSETMLDRRTLTVNLQSQFGVPNSFTGINLTGSFVPLIRRDVLAGNGIMHVVNQVLQ